MAVKVKITIVDTSYWGVNSELLWASESKDGYVLENSPTCAYGFSYKDTVSVLPIDGFLVVTGVVSRGGHSTYRIVLQQDFNPEEWSAYWKPLQDLGCSYESDKSHNIFSVDVRPEADIYAVYKILDRGEDEGFWQFEEGHCGHPV
jgi:hypothetical protein